MKKIICTLIVVIFVLIIILTFYTSKHNKVRFTDDIANYDEASTINPEIFLENIPSSAEIISFSKYSYWSEDNDVYLELKFSSVDVMDAYLNELKENSYQYAPLRNKRKSDWFITQKNPYDTSYTDIFCSYFAIYSEDKKYTGYAIGVNPNETEQSYLFCNYAIISYSYEDMVVIQTRANGTFQIKNNYIPCYLRRFGVPTFSDLERWIYIQ